ncbi:tetratricopeptide repeat protein [Paracoccus ravus]|uniref:tetratricopeptide repeat protein n=1 Tax=Paracoccus ravus TaxID=2447760 RepID=UPI001FD6C3A2|nr:tetratricopeptide repeat protein [Paracoccus ravus]
MRWLESHYQIAVATVLSLSLALPHMALGQSDVPLPAPDLPAPESGPAAPEPPSAALTPAEPEDRTAEARLREREDLDLLFAELAQTEGETWARAETDILRIWSRSGSAAMDLLYKRGEAALDGGELEAAIGHLTALTDHAPDFAAGWYLRGVALYLNGDMGPAISDMIQALALEPRHFPALTQLGTMSEELGDDAKALKAYRASLKIHPHQEDAADAVQRLENKTKGTDA